MDGQPVLKAVHIDDWVDFEEDETLTMANVSEKGGKKIPLNI